MKLPTAASCGVLKPRRNKMDPITVLIWTQVPYAILTLILIIVMFYLKINLRAINESI